jgi:hypothetical protein
MSVLAVITVLTFLKCLGYTLLGILAVGVLLGMLIGASEIWDRYVSHRVPQNVKETLALVLTLGMVLFFLLIVFVAVPITICTAPGGPCS